MPGPSPPISRPLPISLGGWLLLRHDRPHPRLWPLAAAAANLPGGSALSLWSLVPHYLLAFILALRALNPEGPSFPRTALGALGLILLLHALMLVTALAAEFLVLGAMMLAVAIKDSVAAFLIAWIAAIILIGSLYGLAVDLVHGRWRDHRESSRRAWRLAHMLGGAIATAGIGFGRAWLLPADGPAAAIRPTA